MRFRLKETRHTRNISLEIDIKSTDEEFVGLIDVNNSPTKLKPIIEIAWKGLKVGNAPELCEEGVGGTYFMHDETHQKVAVFKPQDEEPFHVNNPKGFSPRRGSESGFKEGILVGEASIRECAAFLLDHGSFAGVPVTDLVLCQHDAFYKEHPQLSGIIPKDIDDFFVIQSPRLAPTAKVKVGSFQEFISHDGNCEELSRKFVEKFEIHQVQKIAQLDLRILNADRHGGNILYKRNLTEHGQELFSLIPIDHGYALPSTLDEAYFEWLHWPQAKAPVENVVKEYIENLNVEEEIVLLREKFANTIRDEHFKILRIMNMLLKKGVAADLTFYQIGMMVCRSNIKVPSTLEVMCMKADSKTPKSDAKSDYDQAYFNSLAEIMDTEIKKLSEK